MYMEIVRQIKYKPAMVVGGYTDRILRVDLGTQEITIQELPPDFKNKYVGGRGYALKMIWDGTSRSLQFSRLLPLSRWLEPWNGLTRLQLDRRW